MNDLQGYTILFLTWLTSTLIVRAIFTKTRRLPPSPLALPIIGHLHLLGPIAHQAFHRLSKRYGPLIHLYLGSAPCVVVSSPEMAKEFLKTNETYFSNRPYMSNADFLTYGGADFACAPYGRHWKFMKKICMSQLLGNRTLEQLSPVRHEERNHFLRLMLKKAKSVESVDIGRELMRVTNNVISRMTLNQRCSENEEEADKVRKMVRDMVELTGKFNLSDFIWFCKNLDLQGFKKILTGARDRYDAMMERYIREHEEARRKKKEMGSDGGDSTNDLLDILLDIAEDKNAERRLTRENIKAFILNIFGAGTDTSAVTMEWALAELINHSDIMEKARQEIDSVVGKGRVVEESDIVKLPYIQAIVKETLRLHPAGPLVVRESTEDCTIGGYKILAQTRLFVNVWALHRDPNHWENPLEFRPERFISEDGSAKTELDVRGQHFHFLPFGTGRRSCPGASLAMQVVPTTVAAMIQCFDWKVGDGGNGTLDMEEGPGLTLPRAHPLVCVPVARLNPFPSIGFTIKN